MWAIMTKWFSPTAENYFSRIGRSAIVTAITEAKGIPAKKSWDRQKKAAFAGFAEREIAGTGWLPKPLVQVGGNCPTLSGPGIRSRSVTVSKTRTPGVGVVTSPTATYNSLRLLIARCGIKKVVDGPRTVLRRC